MMLSFLPRVVQSGGDAVDGGGEGVVESVFWRARAFSAEQVDLDQTHGIDIRITQADGTEQDWVALDEFALAADGEDDAAGALEFLLQRGEDAFADTGIGY